MTDQDTAVIPAAPIGALAFLGAAVAYVTYSATGAWPAGLGGLEVPLLALLGVALLVYGLWGTE